MLPELHAVKVLFYAESGGVVRGKGRGWDNDTIILRSEWTKLRHISAEHGPASRNSNIIQTVCSVSEPEHVKGDRGLKPTKIF